MDRDDRAEPARLALQSTTFLRPWWPDGVGIAIRRRSSRLDVQQRCGDVQRGPGGNEDDIMASVFADEVEWLTDVLAARDVPMDDGSSGEQ